MNANQGYANPGCVLLQLLAGRAITATSTPTAPAVHVIAERMYPAANKSPVQSPLEKAKEVHAKAAYHTLRAVKITLSAPAAIVQMGYAPP